MRITPKNLRGDQIDPIQRDLVLVVMTGLVLALTIVSLGMMVIGQF